MHKFVLTGGPCAGKTSCMDFLTARLTQQGYAVFKTPEAATILINAGLQFGALKTPAQQYAAQRELIKMIIALEDCMEGLARATTDKPAVLLCDRGLLDIRAYMGEVEFEKLLSELGFSLAECRDERYAAVVHLMTAAEGAEGAWPGGPGHPWQGRGASGQSLRA